MVLDGDVYPPETGGGAPPPRPALAAPSFFPASADASVARRLEQLRRLVRPLAADSVCFGDGPRWQPDWVQGKVGRWMRESGLRPLRPEISVM